MDFLDRLKELVEGYSFTPFVIEIGTYKEDGDSIAIVPTPSNISTRYMEKGKVYSFSFQVLVHHGNNLTAYDTINRLNNELDGTKGIVSANNSFSLISLFCTTTPNYIQETVHGTLWTALFNADIYLQGGVS